MPHLIKGKGTVVNISSTLSQRVSVAMLDYCAAKAALARRTVTDMCRCVEPVDLLCFR